MGKPFWHKTDRWACMVRHPGGKREMVYDKAGIAKRDFARAAAWAEREATAAAGLLRVDGDPTLTELRQMYLTWCKKRVAEEKASQHTYDGHRKQLNLVCKSERPGGGTYGSLPIREFTPRTLERLIERWAAGGIGPTTIRNRCASLQAMLNWAANPRADREVERLIERNPIAGYGAPAAASEEVAFASEEEIGAFRAFVAGRAEEAKGRPRLARFERLTALLVRVVDETGCRPGELCDARWADYRPEHRAIIMTKHKTAAKTGRRRHIMLSEETAGAIEWEMARPDRHPTHIFCHRIGSRDKARDGGEKGVPWNSNALCKRIRALRRDAVAAGVLKDDVGPLRLHLYKMRHARITTSIDRGESVADVARLSGNSIETIEKTYLAHRPEHLRSVADRIEEGRKAKGD
jgi:integrase